ncbi:hypothetical protein [Enterococcus sp. LJL51]|uniref:hypothetical protein n=1 Tax=Enterococcus sp. LJL51 TaxID=3416656 RepID=UPI003CF228FE
MNNKKRITMLIFVLTVLLFSGCTIKSKSENKSAINDFLKTFQMKQLKTEDAEKLLPEKIDLPINEKDFSYEYVDAKVINNQLYIILASEKVDSETISTEKRYQKSKLMTYDFQKQSFEEVQIGNTDNTISFECILKDTVYLRYQSGSYKENTEQLGLLELNPATNKTVDKIKLNSKLKDFVIVGNDIYQLYNDEKNEEAIIQKSDFESMNMEQEFEKSDSEFSKLKSMMDKSKAGYSYDYTFFNAIEDGNYTSWTMESGEKNTLFKANSLEAGQRLADEKFLEIIDFYPGGRSGEDPPMHFLTLYNLPEQEQVLLYDDLYINRTKEFQNSYTTPANQTHFLIKDFKGDWARYHIEENVLIKESIPDTENFATTMAMNNGWFFLSDGKTILLIK